MRLKKLEDYRRAVNDAVDDAIAAHQEEINRLQKIRQDESTRLLDQAQTVIPRAKSRHLQRVIQRSFSNVKNYNVDLYIDPQDDTCDCPDHQYRHHACKHIQQARRERAMYDNARPRWSRSF